MRTGCRDSYRGIDQYGVGAHLHGVGRMRRHAQSGVHDHRHAALLDDYREHFAHDDAFVGAYRRCQRHDRRRTGLLQALAEHRIGLYVGQHDKAHFSQPLGGFERLDGIGQQIFRVRVYFELYEVGAEGLACELRRQYRFFGVAHARGVGQQLYAVATYMREHVVLGIGHVDALHGNGNHFGLGCRDSLRHDHVGAELARSDEQARAERPSAYNQFTHCL